jgi:hypothetical protein
MPKHQANLDYGRGSVSSRYGQLCMSRDRPSDVDRLPAADAANYAQFRGMLMKSYVHFRGKAGVRLFQKGSARLFLGSHPRIRALKDLEIEPDPLLTAFIPEASGLLDDYFESWFLSFPEPPTWASEGLESVVNLGLGQQWLEPPKASFSEAARR